VWIGDVHSSGRPEHRTHFRPVADWYQIGPVMGNYTCGSSFKPGTFRRSNENCNGTRFLVVESDALGKDQVGAVFAYLRRRLNSRWITSSARREPSTINPQLPLLGPATASARSGN
jgi:hypothetical protein